MRLVDKSFLTYDTNRDDYIDLEEFKAYIRESFN